MKKQVIVVGAITHALNTIEEMGLEDVIYDKKGVKIQSDPMILERFPVDDVHLEIPKDGKQRRRERRKQLRR